MWSIFLRGVGVYDKSKQPANPMKELLSSISWDLAYYLEIIFNCFKGLTDHVIKNLPKWKEYIQSPDPLETKLPDEWDKQGIFEKILILKVFRPEKILIATSKYVK